MRFFVAALSYLVFLLAAPLLLTHPKLRRGIAARLGFYGRGWPEVATGPRIWMHGASAGDILALLPTVRELRARAVNGVPPQILGTTVTNSGRAILEKHRDLFAAITYLPYDLPGSVTRAIRKIRPDVLVLEYTELWPNLIRTASRRGVRLVLHNGRFSGARLRRYRRLFRLTGNLLQRFALLLMRDQRETERALKLGAPRKRTHMAGNTKFDSLTKPPQPSVVAALREALHVEDATLVWLAGSTHEGEEEILLDQLLEVRGEHPALRFVVAPRYVERAERVAGLAAKRGLTVRLRSKPSDQPTDVVVLDTIGELAAAYALASIVFVGGSFVTRGGQNIMEPAALGKPVLFGPHMHNFDDAVEVLLGRGGIQVQSPRQLKRVLLDLLNRDDHRRELGEHARVQVSRISGAAARNAERIVSLLAQQR